MPWMRQQLMFTDKCIPPLSDYEEHSVVVHDTKSGGQVGIVNYRRDAGNEKKTTALEISGVTIDVWDKKLIKLMLRTILKKYPKKATLSGKVIYPSSSKQKVMMRDSLDELGMKGETTEISGRIELGFTGILISELKL